MIEIDHFTFQYDGNPTPSLLDIDLKIAEGEFVVIAGPSGCGKSTLALALGGFLFRQYAGRAEGQVFVDGMDVRRRPLYDIAEVVGLVQQNPENQFCTLNVADELAFGLENRLAPRSQIAERIQWALEAVGAVELADRPLETLSGGERQKIAIAAMLAQRPRLLILDEPTSNLDPTATNAVLEVVARLRQQTGLTIVIIEHKTAYLARFAPRVMLMREGRIVADGQPALPSLPAMRLRPPAVRGDELLVSARGLALGYEPGKPLLRDLDLEIRAGEFVALMGDNGSGKSTLLRALLGLIEPSAGTLRVLGNPLPGTPVSALARGVGLVFQNPDHQLFAESVWEEALFAPRNFQLGGEAERRAASLLEAYGLSPYRQRHPHRLSYGEKRRLNLASVLSYAPRLLLLDEPLIGQDPANAAFLMEQLAEFAARGGAVLASTHDPETTARYATRALFLEGGRLALDAPPPQLFAELRSRGRYPYLPLYATAEGGE
jgi:energy-coupling factor transport system ATP-binding protein